MIEINVDDRIPVCASAKICFNDLCEIIDEDDYHYQVKYCFSLLTDCYKEMEEYPIPYQVYNFNKQKIFIFKIIKIEKNKIYNNYW